MKAKNFNRIVFGKGCQVMVTHKHRKMLKQLKKGKKDLTK